MKTELEKLELKHMAAYLPYELEVKANDTVAPGVLVSIVAGMPGLLLYDDKDNIEYYELSDIKPLLIPLTAIADERLLTLASWLHRKEGESFDSELQAADWVLIAVTDNYENMPYGFAERLLSELYDVFGLIDTGLAINKLSL